MPLIPYSQLVEIDISKECDMRDAKDDTGKKIKVPYLNWAKCISLLRQHGAEEVYYTPLKNENGSFVFVHYETQNKDGRKTGCYFVSVEIHIDGLTYTMDMPLMNGSLVIYEDTLNQLRIDNCHKRAFVKGVAIHTGLGFKLWSDDIDTDRSPDDLSQHDIYAVKTRIELLMTAKMKKLGIDERGLCDLIELPPKTLKLIMDAISNVGVLEKKLSAL